MNNVEQEKYQPFTEVVIGNDGIYTIYSLERCFHENVEHYLYI